MKLKHMALAATLSVVLSGCVSSYEGIMSTGSAVSSGQKRSAVNPSHVKLYYGNSGVPKHHVIGRIAVDNMNMVGMSYSQAGIAEELKKQAASIGANGVMNIQTGLMQTTGDAIVSKRK